MRAPVLAVGDGALGFWNGLREVFPETAEQRCWVHKTANILDALPKSAQPAAKKALAEIWGGEGLRQGGGESFEAAYGAMFPKAIAKITDDLGGLLAFYDYPAAIWPCRPYVLCIGRRRGRREAAPGRRRISRPARARG